MKKSEVAEFAKEAGFEKIEFFSDFEKNSFEESTSDYLLAVIR